MVVGRTGTGVLRMWREGRAVPCRYPGHPSLSLVRRRGYSWDVCEWSVRCIAESEVSERGVPRNLQRATVSRLIRERRLARGLTQEQAAEKAGVSIGAWRSTESGTRRPRPHTFAAILDTLELSPDDAELLAPRPVEIETARGELAELCRDELPDEAVGPLLELVWLLTR